MAPEKSGSMDLFARMRKKASDAQERVSEDKVAAQAVKSMVQRTARVAESIMENERLTADLDDDAAKVLIDWGVACARLVAQRTTGMDDAEAEEAMYPGLRATRRMMRTMNDWIAEGQGIGGVERLAFLDKVIEHAALVYGGDFAPPSPAQRKTFLRQHLADPPPHLIASLRELIEDECLTGGRSSDDQEKREKNDRRAFD